jgi:DNA transformation protein
VGPVDQPLIRHDGFVEFVAEQLAPLGEVRPRRMFGGWGVYVDDVFIAIVAGDTLWLEVDDGNRADYDAAGAPAFRPFADREMVMSYREVPADVLDDRTAIVEWARKAMEAARRSGTKPKRRVKRRSD